MVIVLDFGTLCRQRKSSEHFQPEAPASDEIVIEQVLSPPQTHTAAGLSKPQGPGKKLKDIPRGERDAP